MYRTISTWGLACVLLLVLYLCSACSYAAVRPPVDEGNNNPPAGDPNVTPDVPDTPGDTPPADKPDDQGTSDEPPVDEPVIPDYDFNVTVLDESFRFGGSLETVEWSYKLIGAADLANQPWNASGHPYMSDLIELDIFASGAQNLKEFVCEIEFDGFAMFPEIIWPGPELLDDVNWWLTSPTEFSFIEDNPHLLRLAISVVNQDENPGVSGDLHLVRFWFTQPGWSSGDPYPAPTAYGDVYAAPQLEDCRPVLSYDEEAGLLRWGHNLPGDFNQDGAVNYLDPLEITRFFGDQATGIDSIAGVLTGSADGIVNVGLFSAIGMHHHNVLTGYNVYGGAAADYPAGGELLGTVLLDAATGDPAVERLQFSFALEPEAGTSYWIKPEYNGETGIPSEMLSF